MHWPIQATILILCIVTCSTAQRRGPARQSALQEAIAEEDVDVKNHRFQAARHGSRNSQPAASAASREFQTRQSSNRQETVSAEVASTRRSFNSRVDNEIIRNGPRFQQRQQQQVDIPSSTVRQYSARSRPSTEANVRRRNDVNLSSTEEVVTRGNYRTRSNDKIRGFTGRGAVEQESTTSQIRGRGFASRGEKDSQERTTSQIRTRNGNTRQNEANQSRTGRGRNLAPEEPTTQSLRPRGRAIDRATVNEIKTSAKVEATTSRVSDRPSRFNEPSRTAISRENEPTRTAISRENEPTRTAISRENEPTRIAISRENEPTRIASSRENEPSRTAIFRQNEQRISGDNSLVTRGRGRTVIRGRTSPRTEAPSAPAVEVTSSKLIEEVSASSSSEIPLDTSGQQQPIIDEKSTLDAPLIKPNDIPLPEEISGELSTKNINSIASEQSSPSSAVPIGVEEIIKEVTTARLNAEINNGRSNFRGRLRSGANPRSRTNENTENYESVTRGSRRNPQRITSRPDSTSRSSVERPASARGRGRARVESTRNGQKDLDAPTTNNYRGRNHLQQSNIIASSTPYDLPQIIDPSNPVTPGNERKVNDDLPTAIAENDRLIPSDSEIQANIPTTGPAATTARQLVPSERPLSSLLARKPGRGSARAPKTEVISCSCFTKAACNLVDCPQF